MVSKYMSSRPWEPHLKLIDLRIINDEFNKFIVFLVPNMNESLSPDKNDDT